MTGSAGHVRLTSARKPGEGPADGTAATSGRSPAGPPPDPAEDSTPTVAFARPKLFDWEAWRARTGGAEGRRAIGGGTGRDRSSGPWGNRRTVGAVLAVVAVCAVLGGVAAFAATLGGPSPSPAAARFIPPGDVSAPGPTTGQGVAPGGRPNPSLTPLPAPTGQPANGANGADGATPHADPFSAAVTGYLAGRAGTVLAAIDDLRTGQTWALGTGRPQPTGSIVKIDILQTLLAGQPSGLSAADRALARSMIENNLNPPATALWNQIGQAAGLSSYNAAVGLQRTTPSTCLVCAGFGWPGWGLTTTTPADQLLLLHQLVSGPLLSPAARGYALSLMENVQPDQRWGVSAGVPPGVRVALKNAWVPLTAPGTNWQVNSEGWLSGDGRDYLIAVFTTGNPDEQYGIDTINTLAAIVWPAMQ